MSTIPDFDHNHVLPPHLGNPTESTHLSPYLTTTLELCHRFATSKERIEILKCFIHFRLKMTSLNILTGFQWLDGSFLENIEASENRPPGDLDVVTFFGGLSSVDFSTILSLFPEFADPLLSKSNYHLDHYAVDYCYDPNVTVESTRYWIQLFTHNRKGIWKGIIHLPINTDIDDHNALIYLNNINI